MINCTGRSELYRSGKGRSHCLGPTQRCVVLAGTILSVNHSTIPKKTPTQVKWMSDLTKHALNKTPQALRVMLSHADQSQTITHSADVTHIVTNLQACVSTVSPRNRNITISRQNDMWIHMLGVAVSAVNSVNKSKPLKEWQYRLPIAISDCIGLRSTRHWRNQFRWRI